MRRRPQRRSIVVVIFLALFNLLPPSAVAQPTGCVPNADDGCVLEFGRPAQGAITNLTGAAHVWRLIVPVSGSFGVVLTNSPARYRLAVYAPGADRQTDVPEQSTDQAGEYLFVEAASPGAY